MKLLSFLRSSDGLPEAGALGDDGSIVPLTQPTADHRVTMLSLIEGGDHALRLARDAIKHPALRLDPETIRWLAPLDPPAQIRDFLVFEEHARAAGWRGAQIVEKFGGPAAPTNPPPLPEFWEERPFYYKGNRFAMSGHGDTILWPSTSNIIDYELEIACVIGRAGRDIQVKDGLSHIFGFTIFNDLTARDLQFKEMRGPLGPAKGKDFDGANAMGPFIVTTDELGTAETLAMRAFVNGELWSEGSTSSMGWSFPELVAYASTGETLHPGEVLGSGTVGGGCGLELGRFLKDGDVVELEIEGIGRLKSSIAAPHVRDAFSL